MPTTRASRTAALVRLVIPEVLGFVAVAVRTMAVGSLLGSLATAALV